MDLKLLKPLIIICGHYGSGKTNLSLNIALDLAAAGEQVTLVDLDLVNPYFRSSDYGEMLAEHGVEMIAPTFAGTTLDIPTLSPAVSGAFERPGRVIFDVGGDDVGATALGRYSRQIGQIPYDFLYVVNKYRPLSREAEQSAELLREIEAASHLRATAVVNNSHLQMETDWATVASSRDYAVQSAKELGLPLIMTTVPDFVEIKEPTPDLYPVRVLVRTPWGEAFE